MRSASLGLHPAGTCSGARTVAGPTRPGKDDELSQQHGLYFPWLYRRLWRRVVSGGQFDVSWINNDDKKKKKTDNMTAPFWWGTKSCSVAKDCLLVVSDDYRDWNKKAPKTPLARVGISLSICYLIKSWQHIILISHMDMGILVEKKGPYNSALMTYEKGNMWRRRNIFS